MSPAPGAQSSSEGNYCKVLRTSAHDLEPIALMKKILESRYPWQTASLGVLLTALVVHGDCWVHCGLLLPQGTLDNKVGYIKHGLMIVVICRPCVF